MSLLRVNRRQTEQEHNTPLMRRGRLQQTKERGDAAFFENNGKDTIIYIVLSYNKTVGLPSLRVSGVIKTVIKEKDYECE
jgi:hypothetical protein